MVIVAALGFGPPIKTESGPLANHNRPTNQGHLDVGDEMGEPCIAHTPLAYHISSLSEHGSYSSSGVI